MKLFKALMIILTLSVLIVSTGCSTVTALAASPFTGGTSLTARLWQSEDAPDGIKTVGSPFTFVVGTVIAPFPSVTKGIKKDLSGAWDSEDFLYVLDPFDANLFARKKP